MRRTTLVSNDVRSKDRKLLCCCKNCNEGFFSPGTSAKYCPDCISIIDLNNEYALKKQALLAKITANKKRKIKEQNHTIIPRKFLKFKRLNNEPSDYYLVD